MKMRSLFFEIFCEFVGIIATLCSLVKEYVKIGIEMLRRN